MRSLKLGCTISQRIFQKPKQRRLWYVRRKESLTNAFGKYQA
jgi:hypothetical protein